ncbi:MAG: hypothetical protein NTV08_20340 [Verrucomicrobia bacterium]|nr:hypothetical protein [Verrucomicrobiota bacterium]
MNIRTMLCGGIALVSMVTFAKADVTLNFTGSTAFRTTVTNAIKNQYLAEPIATRSFAYVHNATAGNPQNATAVTFAGKFPGVAGITTINFLWGGSLSGIKNVSSGTLIGFIDTSASGQTLPTATAAGAEKALATSGTATFTAVNAAANFAFSDVLKSLAPAANTVNISGPADPKVGVLIFAPIVNNGTTGFSNCTTQQFQVLLKNGFQPRRLWTNVNADTDRIYCVGRDDGSGTRAFYLAETGLGVTKTVNQYCVTQYGTGAAAGTITRIGLTPVGVTSGNFKKSTLWSHDQDGNGGYNSGDQQNADFGLTSPNCTPTDATFPDPLDGSSDIAATGKLGLMCMIGGADAKAAVTAGARALSWNGVGIDFTLATPAPGDVLKVYQGTYTCWSYENLYYKTAPGAGSDTLAVYNALKSQINTELTGLTTFDGVALSLMRASRGTDGGTVASIVP